MVELLAHRALKGAVLLGLQTAAVGKQFSPTYSYSPDKLPNCILTEDVAISTLVFAGNCVMHIQLKLGKLEYLAKVKLF